MAHNVRYVSQDLSTLHRQSKGNGRRKGNLSFSSEKAKPIWSYKHKVLWPSGDFLLYGAECLKICVLVVSAHAVRTAVLY